MLGLGTPQSIPLEEVLYKSHNEWMYPHTHTSAFPKLWSADP